MKVILVLLILFCNQFAQNKFSHILITNDDGIEDAKRLLALANSVSEIADRVLIVVSSFDRSGTSNYSEIGKYKSTIEIECKYIDKDRNISAYEVSGNPADCVMIGLGGLFENDRPDFVISGINSGSNIGEGWFESGTVGAARTAAFLGVKAIAFSGFDKDKESSYTVIPNWIKRLLNSGFADNISKNSYLTVGLPRVDFDKIKGIKIVPRQISFNHPDQFKLKKIHGDNPHTKENKSIWTIETSKLTRDSSLKNDTNNYIDSYIIITAMSIDENDITLSEKLNKKLLPEFNTK